MLAKQFKKKKSENLKKSPMKSESEVKKPERKPKLKKKKRLIVRNLAFQVNEADLKKVFSAFGNVIDVKIPLKPDGRKKGFGFVEFDNTKSLIQAMKSMNYKEIKGRKVAIDFAVDKNTYQSKIKSLNESQSEKPKPKLDKSKTKSENSSDDNTDDESENDDEEEEDNEEEEDEEEEDEDEKRLNAFLREFDSGAEALTKSKASEDEQQTSDSEESSYEESDDESDQETSDKKRKNNDSIQNSPAKKPKKESQDVSEGKTVFIRNVSFTTTNESLKEALEDFGECEYNLICVDPNTDHPRGTAFIKFKEKSSADRLIEDSFKEPGVIVDGRRLTCSYAISREEVSRMNDAPKKPKDKRNLNLLRVGLIMQNSKESEGVSHADMARRAQLEMTKKIKLRNVNFFVSDTRLVIHNLPRVYSDGELRKLFKNAAGPGAVITEARVMKEFGKTDASGNPVSKGFGFITFTKHEHALNALNELNNNPDIFTTQRRPIVEFAVENKVAILSKEKRKEKFQLRNKKRTEEKMARQKQELQEKAVSENEPSSKKKKKKNKATESKKHIVKEKPNKAVVSQTTANDASLSESKQKKKKKPKKKNKGKNIANVKSNQASVSDLVNKYKDKLKNKIT